MATAPGAGPAPLPVATTDRLIGGVAALFLLVGMPIAWLTDDPGTGDWIFFAIALVANLALLAYTLRSLVPEWREGPNAGRIGLIAGLVAVLLGLVFWLGLSIVIGAAALAVGLSARYWPAVGLGALAMVGGFVALLVG